MTGADIFISRQLKLMHRMSRVREEDTLHKVKYQKPNETYMRVSDNSHSSSVWLIEIYDHSVRPTKREEKELINFRDEKHWMKSAQLCAVNAERREFNELSQNDMMIALVIALKQQRTEERKEVG